MVSRKIYEENPQAVDPPMFIATAYDKASEAWTRSSPNSMVSNSSNISQITKTLVSLLVRSDHVLVNGQ